jgi:hypothetical protein
MKRILRIKFFFERFANDSGFWKYIIEHGEFAIARSMGVIRSIDTNESARDYYFSCRYIKMMRPVANVGSTWQIAIQEPEELDMRYIRKKLISSYSDLPIESGLLVSEGDNAVAVIAETFREGISKLIDNGILDIGFFTDTALEEEIENLADACEILRNYNRLSESVYIEEIRLLNGNRPELKKYLFTSHHFITDGVTGTIFDSYDRIITYIFNSIYEYGFKPVTNFIR